VKYINVKLLFFCIISRQFGQHVLEGNVLFLINVTASLLLKVDYRLFPQSQLC